MLPTVVTQVCSAKITKTLCCHLFCSATELSFGNQGNYWFEIMLKNELFINQSIKKKVWLSMYLHMYTYIQVITNLQPQLELQDLLLVGQEK